MKVLEIFIDGASRGNPGEASIAVIINSGGERIREVARLIGHATNNVAEYQALQCALEQALELQAESLKIFTDSELLYRQMIGEYQIKNEQLKVIFETIQKLAANFQMLEIKHIPREQNKEADRLANSVFKNKQAKMVAPVFRPAE